MCNLIDSDMTNDIIMQAGIEWLHENTTIDFKEVDDLPSCAKLFLIKFGEIHNMQSGVSSESIEGLSQSFNTGNKTALIWDLAENLLGNYLKIGSVRFVSASPRWK